MIYLKMCSDTSPALYNKLLGLILCPNWQLGVHICSCTVVCVLHDTTIAHIFSQGSKQGGPSGQLPSKFGEGPQNVKGPNGPEKCWLFQYLTCKQILEKSTMVLRKFEALNFFYTGAQTALEILGAFWHTFFLISGLESCKSSRLNDSV